MEQQWHQSKGMNQINLNHDLHYLFALPLLYYHSKETKPQQSRYLSMSVHKLFYSALLKAQHYSTMVRQLLSFSSRSSS